APKSPGSHPGPKHAYAMSQTASKPGPDRRANYSGQNATPWRVRPRSGTSLAAGKRNLATVSVPALPNPLDPPSTLLMRRPGTENQGCEAYHRCAARRASVLDPDRESAIRARVTGRGGADMGGRVCLRCDWTGETDGAAC